MRQSLKEHSAPLHRKLDRVPALSDLVGPRLNLSDYRRRLNAFVLIYDELEAEISTLETMADLDVLPVYATRLPALEHDLTQLDRWLGEPLGMSCPSVDTTRMSTQWHYFGMRYVLEGATQGAPFIAVRLRESLPQLFPLASAFWQLQLCLANIWPTFCGYLARPTPSVEALRQMLEGADRAFGAFSERFLMLNRRD